MKELQNIIDDYYRYTSSVEVNPNTSEDAKKFGKLRASYALLNYFAFEKYKDGEMNFKELVNFCAANHPNGMRDWDSYIATGADI